MSVLLTRRAVVQVKMEAVSGTEETPDNNDGILVSEPTYTIDPKMLERDFTRASLSKTPHIIGQKLAKMEFTTELRGNGKQQSGINTDAALITRLFRMCGYAMTAHAACFAKGVYEVGDHANKVTWAVDTTDSDNVDAICYHIKVTTGGASGVAQITVTSDTSGEGSGAATVTTATEVDLGTHGLVVTPTFTGNLASGQEWIVWVFPKGMELAPVSDNFESGTLRMNKDGVLHAMPGAFGTFEIEATAGEYAKIKWTFTGIYKPPVDAALTSPNYERTLPSMVELARLRVGSFAAIVEKFTFNQQNDIQVRPDVNSAEGYIGTRIVSRAPEGGINPEADLVANNDFWGQLARADRMPFQMRVGHTVGNTVWVIAPGVQYSGMTYQDRNGILTYDAGLKFPAYTNDDEAFFLFI